MVESITPNSHHHILLPPLLILLILFIVGLGNGYCLEEKRVVTLQRLQWGDQKSPSHRFSLLRRSRGDKPATIMLEMKHHFYSSVPIQNLDGDNLQNLLLSDDARVSSLQSRFKATTSNQKQKHPSAAQIPLISGIKLQTLNYVATVEFGNRNMTVIIDTGSDLTWIQCKPCSYCYNQQDPLFDPSASSSYKSVPCNSTYCISLRSSTGNSGSCGSDRSSCRYALSYGDGSYTRGVLAQDRINLGGADFGGFIFGCGRSNRGLFGGTSGLMGLGKTKLSLVSQTKAQFGGIFSYCLPSRVYNSSGNLVFGGDSSVYRNTTPISYTRLISDPMQAPFYFLNLTSVKVGGVAIQALGFSRGKILIDSGTVITRVVPSVYKAMRAEFVRQFSGYPPAPEFSILDTCFDLSGYDEVRVPTLRLGFEGSVEMNVDVTGIFYFVKSDASQVCLAIASLSDEEQVGIIGNYQQKNQRVVYDSLGSRVGFAQESCSYI